MKWNKESWHRGWKNTKYPNWAEQKCKRKLVPNMLRKYFDWNATNKTRYSSRVRFGKIRNVHSTTQTAKRKKRERLIIRFYILFYDINQFGVRYAVEQNEKKNASQIDDDACVWMSERMRLPNGTESARPMHPHLICQWLERCTVAIATVYRSRRPIARQNWLSPLRSFAGTATRCCTKCRWSCLQWLEKQVAERKKYENRR